MKLVKSIRGFTLIELMIAISIVAILSTIGLVQYGNAQKIARDAKRKQDLRSIATALELHRQTTGSYPISNAWTSSDSGSNPWISQLTQGYINITPKDPKNRRTYPIHHGYYIDNYVYSYWAGPTLAILGGYCPVSAGKYYVLVTQLENTSDPDRNAVRNYRWCDGNPLSGWSPQSFIITSQ